LRYFLHKEHAIEFGLQIVLLEQIFKQPEVVLEPMAESQIPFRILYFLVGELVLAPVITATSVELKNELRGFRYVRKARGGGLFFR